MSYDQQIKIILLEKGLLVILVGIVGFVLNRLLERYRSMQAQSLEAFKQEQMHSLEEFKTSLARRVDVDRSIQAAIADLSKKLATAAHTMQWLTWDAEHCPETITPQRFEIYDKEMHIILSEIVSLRAVLAALSPRLHQAITPFAKRIYKLDADIAKAKNRFSIEKHEALQMLESLYPSLDEFDHLFLAEVEKCSESITNHKRSTEQPLSA